jgi:collagen type V/XI/XXIV/XXVII alpha
LNTIWLAGWYWIDPNLGMPDDAIYVFCNMTGSGETCVYPDLQSSKMPNIPWRKEVGGKEEWYSNMRGASKVTYETVGVVQMTFLRLLSQKAHQNFTFTCVNSAAWYNQRTFNYDQVLFSVSVALSFLMVARHFVSGVCIINMNLIPSPISCHEQAIKLLGDNEQEFSAKGVRPNVILDGCKVPFFFSFSQVI